LLSLAGGGGATREMNQTCIKESVARLNGDYMTIRNATKKNEMGANENRICIFMINKLKNIIPDVYFSSFRLKLRARLDRNLENQARNHSTRSGEKEWHIFEIIFSVN